MEMNMKTNDTGTAVPRSKRSGLVVLNLFLLLVLGTVMLAPDVGAQIRGEIQNPRVRGEYALVGGETLGDNASTVYVLDSANRQLVALRWNDSSKSLEGVGFRDLVRDANSDPDR
ncbi:MAG: hypothetical protein CMJ35_00875 [Phycisphaerae bacterium]|nr:hypothetical protein [Phycisphaerae bacterium]HCT46510.1 hypothetical protein [Phycisphaerales bacterium]